MELEEAPVAEEPEHRLPGPLDWLVGRVTGREGTSGAIVPAGWALYNGMWLAIMGGFGATARPLLLYSGAISLTVLFAAGVTVSRWRHPVEPRQRAVSLRGDAGLCGAIGVCFGGLAVVFGYWWAPLSLVMLVMGVWLAVKDASARHRAPR